MSAALLNFYSDRNVGDAAILASLRTMLGATRLPALGLDDRDAATRADLLISVGGDIFNNGRPGLITRRFLAKTRQLGWAPERTVLFGQSIPPSCDGVALRLLARRLRRLASVTVRDDESARKLAGHGVAAKVSHDSAFALTANDADFAAARAAYFHEGLAAETTALFSVRSFNRMYPAHTEGYVARLGAAMRLLCASNWRVAVLLQADVDACDGDRAMIAALRREVPGLAVVDPFAHGDTPWRTALGAVAMAGTVVGTRYHTAVFGMVAGRVPVSLWYSNKGADLVKRFALPGASADAFDPARIAALARENAGARFDPAPARRRVKADFASAIRAVPAHPARRERRMSAA